METCCILYNPKAGNGRGQNEAHRLDTIWNDKKLEYVDITGISDIRSYLEGLPSETIVVLAGGDGTLNHFINDLNGEAPARDIYFLAAGSGNDFLRDVEHTRDDPPFLINPYIQNLPTVTVNGMTRFFLNGIGYGIDGYCCEVGDKQRLKSDKPVNYTAIAIKGLLLGYRRTRADVCVDGDTRSYRSVWLAPTMKGRYYGGGMMCAPGQDRLNPDGSVSAMIMTGKSKLKTLIVFPSIFKGKHVAHEEMVTIRPGHEITVRFNRPTALQIDGETVLGVTEYSVSTGRRQS
jgi:diacylglycerol kinase (ATP)